MDAEMAADLRAVDAEMAEANLARQEFHLACQLCQWERAEAARLKVLAHTEASLDAFMRANKRLAIFSGKNAG